MYYVDNHADTIRQNVSLLVIIYYITRNIVNTQKT